MQNPKIKFILIAVILLVLAGSLLFLKNGYDREKTLIPIIIASAVTDSINPCALSILVLTIAFLFSLGKLRLSILKIGLAYICGIYLVYLLIGLGIIQVLHFFDIPHFMAKVGAGIIILFGVIEIINEFFPKFPIKLKIPKAAHQRIALYIDKASIPTSFILGTFVGVWEFPCTGGPYLLVLGLLHDQATFLKGFLYLLLYNLIFVLPLVIILLVASNKILLEKVQEWRKQESGIMRFAIGLVMIILGLIIFAL